MNCKNCDYPLWNIRNRQCPECGTPFVPSEFDFVPNSVAFCCPHCDQSYYGIGARGHLEPRQFECIKCQNLINMDEMILRPTAGVDQRATKTDRMPWFERNERGTFKAWFSTMGAAMSSPASLIRAVPRDHSAGSAWLFMFVSNLIFLSIGSGIPLLFMLVLFKILAAKVPAFAGMGPLMFNQTVWQFPFHVVLVAALPPVWACLAHWFLMFGGKPREKLSRTAHCIYYSSACNALSAIPCGNCAQLGGQIWWLVSAILMVKETHRVSGGRATFAVLGSGLIIGVAVAAASIVISIMTMGFPGTAGGFANYGASIGANFIATSVSGEMTTYTIDHNGRGPAHAIELLGDGTKQTFIDFTVTTDANSVSVGDTTLADFKRLSTDQRREIIDDLVANQPKHIVAHRLGDIVFVYHGINFRDADSKLWSFIIAPEPTATNWAPSIPLTIARVNGTNYQISRDKFAAELQSQNRFRAKAGLPPLPDDVLAITATTPAIAAPPPTTAPDRTPPDDEWIDPESDVDDSENN